MYTGAREFLGRIGNSLQSFALKLSSKKAFQSFSSLIASEICTTTMKVVDSSQPTSNEKCTSTLKKTLWSPIQVVPQSPVSTQASKLHARRRRWLNRPGGQWRNSWYEDFEGMKWYSDMVSDDDTDSSLGIRLAQFSMLTDEELECDDPRTCSTVLNDNWGSKFSSTSVFVSKTSIVVYNGKHYGLYYTVKSVYDWKMLLSNVVVFQILLHWMVAMVALHRGFEFLPLTLLPHSKMTLFAFWTTGCVFEGSQRALAEAWFVSYPAIVKVILLYFSLLNFFAKLCRVRASDAMFGPTRIFLCALRWLSEPIANSDLRGSDGRVATLISIAAFSELTLLDFFTSNLALRTNGDVTSIFLAKLLVFTLGGLVPFVWGLRGRRAKQVGHDDLTPMTPGSRIEEVLAIRIANTGGIGRAQALPTTKRSIDSSTRGPSRIEDTSRAALDSNELARLGYLVFGDGEGTSDSHCSYLISIDDWDTLTLLAPLRKVTHLWNHRAKVFPLQVPTTYGVVAAFADEPELCHVDDPRIQGITWWEVSSRSIQ